MDLEQSIEALLFYRGELTSLKELKKTLGVNDQEIAAAIGQLRQRLLGRGIELVEHEGGVELRASKKAAALIQRVRKEELTKDLGKAAAETLSIVLYKGEAARSEIDFIRGVNSTSMLRNLLIRGLVRRVLKKGGRGYRYRPTTELLAHLGITRMEDLPDYIKVKADLEAFEKHYKESEEDIQPE